MTVTMTGMMIATIDEPGVPCDDDLHDDDDDEDDDDDAKLGFLFFSLTTFLFRCCCFPLPLILSVSHYDNSEIRGTKPLILYLIFEIPSETLPWAMAFPHHGY
jgi:hypothetical protein